MSANCINQAINGARKGTRTPNLQFRKLLHYPVVLYGHVPCFNLQLSRRIHTFHSRSVALPTKAGCICSNQMVSLTGVEPVNSRSLV